MYIQMVLRVGDSDVPYSIDFRLFITTKLSNPHYMPDVCIKVTLINFTVTVLGLENQVKRGKGQGRKGKELGQKGKRVRVEREKDQVRVESSFFIFSSPYALFLVSHMSIQCMLPSLPSISPLYPISLSHPSIPCMLNYSYIIGVYEQQKEQ